MFIETPFSLQLVYCTYKQMENILLFSLANELYLKWHFLISLSWMKGEVVGLRPTGLVHSSLIKKELFSLQCFGFLALVFLGSHLHSLGYI